MTNLSREFEGMGHELIAEIEEVGARIDGEKRIMNAWETLTGRTGDLKNGGYLSAELMLGKQGLIGIELHKKDDKYSLVVDDLSFVKGDKGYEEAVGMIRNVYFDLKSTGVSVELVVPEIVFNIDADEIKNDILGQNEERQNIAA